MQSTGDQIKAYLAYQIKAYLRPNLTLLKGPLKKKLLFHLSLRHLLTLCLGCSRLGRRWRYKCRQRRRPCSRQQGEGTSSLSPGIVGQNNPPPLAGRREEGQDKSTWKSAPNDQYSLCMCISWCLDGGVGCLGWLCNCVCVGELVFFVYTSVECCASKYRFYKSV